MDQAHYVMDAVVNNPFGLCSTCLAQLLYRLTAEFGHGRLSMAEANA